jgi:hypothetical protein
MTRRQILNELELFIYPPQNNDFHATLRVRVFIALHRSCHDPAERQAERIARQTAQPATLS